MNKKKIVIVGGVAGGASTAARARRIDAEAEIIMLEKGTHVSFSNCCLPYYLSETIEDSEDLILMDPESFHNSYDIDARELQEVLNINRSAKKITILDHNTQKKYEETYDTLVLSTGAEPIMPKNIEGITADHVFSVRNVEDVVRLKQFIQKKDANDIVVVGGGFIGIEVAENLKLSGRNVTLVEAANQILAPFDYDMVQILHKELKDHGIDLIVEDGIKKIDSNKVILVSGKEKAADVVVMAIGVSPNVSLAVEAGLEIGMTGGIRVNQQYQTSDSNIYAVGDAVEAYHQLLHVPTRLALAGPAQRQARAAADSMYGIPHNNKGVIGSCAVRIFNLNAAATGLNEKTAKNAGISCESIYIIPMDKVGLMPDSSVIHFKLIFEYPTGRILGAQAIGRGNVDKRIDVIAAMLTMGATLEDLKELELCYSPVFGTAKDVVNQAALVGLNILYGRVRQVPVTQVRELVEKDACIIDVREANEFARGHLKNARNIPLSELRGRVDEIPKDQPVYLHCRSSQRSYNAIMALQGRGYQNLYNISGSFLGISLYEYFNDIRLNRKKIVTEYNFN